MVTFTECFYTSKDEWIWLHSNKSCEIKGSRRRTVSKWRYLPTGQIML